MEEWDIPYGASFEQRQDIVSCFQKNGFIVVRSLLTSSEHARLRTCLEHPAGVRSHYYERDDGAGSKSRTVAWNRPRDDITGMVARCEKVAGTFEKLLGGELYHFHSKVIMKEARCGGQHAWHQDYGYWYLNGCLFPNMGTVWIPIDKTDQENGCVQVLVGSHHLGRVDHLRVGQQVGADLERVKHAQSVCRLLHVEMEPGDALFFHCNVLHRSDQNHSDRRRWGLAIAYNRRGNDPQLACQHLGYNPLNKVSNSNLAESSDVPAADDPDYVLGPKNQARDFTLISIDKKQSAQ